MIILTEKEFKELYGDTQWALIGGDGRYNNLPEEEFILTDCTDIDGNPTSKLVAIDNTTSECWLEEFDTIAEAVAYLKRDYAPELEFSLERR